MIRKVAALAVLAALLLAGCTRSSSNSGGGTPDQVYAAGPTTQDIRSLLGSDTWWPGTPDFKIRPLGLPTMADEMRFVITQHFFHIGSSESLILEYDVWNSVSTATTLLTFQKNNTTLQTGPKEGDDVGYSQGRVGTDSSLYLTIAIVRVGAVLINVVLSQAAGFASTTEMGRIANRLVSRLKAALKGTVKPSPLPSSDQQLLLPLGTEVTLAAAVRLPIEVSAELLGAGASPQQVVDSFNQRGVKDLLYGDYALNADLNMEVRAIVFSFSNDSDAASWIDAAIGAGNLDAQGVASGYAASIGEYYAFILAGSHVGLLFCNSLSPYEAASRACEAPLGSIIDSWQSRLAA